MKIRIVPYSDRHKEAFRALNESWIREYFHMEPADHRSLENPREYILDKGGAILVAESGPKTIGVCALIRSEVPEYDFELSKMGVDKAVRGQGVGLMPCRAILDKARDLGASAVYLESNTALEPAISLYRKVGFREVDIKRSAYGRSNIQMAINIDTSL